MNSQFLKMVYRVKPFLPASLEFLLRRARARALLPRYSNVWPIDERASTRPKGWTGWPEGKKFALVLTHDVEWECGHDTCAQLCTLEEDLGFRSAFYFVPHRYTVSPELRADIVARGFEVGVHGLKHDGKLYSSREVFLERAEQINNYLKEWDACGFRSPAVHHELDWLRDLNIEYDASTFDTDPLQPQPDGLRRIYPLWIPPKGDASGYVELPYTLAQDWKVFSILRSKNIELWKRKLDWIAEQGGMALVLTHPDYMQFGDRPKMRWDYPADFYRELLEYVQERYAGEYWHALPRDVARFWAAHPEKEADHAAWANGHGGGRNGTS